VHGHTEGNPGAARALLGDLREGSGPAWAELYDRFAPGIHWLAQSLLLGDVEAAEDIVVETMAAAAKDIRRFDPGRSSLSAWLYGIARRRVAMELRRRKRLKSPPPWAQLSMEEADELGDKRDESDAVLERLDAGRQVAEIAAQLSDVEMTLLVLSSVEELSVKGMAQAIGRTEQAVHSALHRARRKARDRLVSDG
jgi:RNA polymerase sigma-70 factor (ECF subfamily)